MEANSSLEIETSTQESHRPRLQLVGSALSGLSDRSFSRGVHQLTVDGTVLETHQPCRSQQVECRVTSTAVA